MTPDFWSRFPQAGCLPYNCNCELIHQGWIYQPSAFWSSLIYIILGVVLWKKVPQKTQLLKIFIFFVIAQGIFSQFAHGTFLKLALAMDFAGIIVIISFFTVIKFWKKNFALKFFIYYAFLLGVFYSLHLWVKVALCVLIFVISITDIINSLKGEFKTSKTLHQSLSLLFVSFTFFLVDETKLICVPETWLQGHSIWHFGSAYAIYLYGKWRFLEREPFKAMRDNEIKL